MRDPKRIDTVLAKVKEVWSQYPDLRLTQLLECVTLGLTYNKFLIEDSELMELLDVWKDE